MAEQQAEHARMESELAAKLAHTERALDAASMQLDSSQNDLVGLKDQLGAERIARHIAEQRNLDLSERLADAERYQVSLEEKHRHARDALEHYRSASAEQREQENRRYEHQVQALQVELRQTQLAAAVKQEELTRLNKEAAALATELGTTKQALYGERQTGRNLARRIEQLEVVVARVAVLEANLAESRAKTLEAEQASEKSAELCNELRRQNTVLEAQLAGAKGALALEERLTKLDQAVFGAKEPGPSSTKAP
jgi:chromosome segregation ATPase